jgi:hypothetical protein
MTGLIRPRPREFWLRKLVRKHQEKRLFATADARSVFEWIYRTNKWGDPESVSGKGSNLERTRNLREQLPGLLHRLGIRTLLDAPCGDFHWMRHTALDLDGYVGADIVQDLIDRNNVEHAAPSRRFVCLDLACDPLPPADAILCRDCLVHLDLPTIGRVLANLATSGSRYLLTTSHRLHGDYVDKVTGKHRLINLERPPFDWPAPIEQIVESVPPGGRDSGKILGVWRIEDISL